MRLPRDETFNWVRRVSVELTGQMLATLFDVPQEDRHKLIHWSDTVERIADPDYFETAAEGFKELWTCFEYFNAIWRERAAKADQGEDLISFLARGEATRNMSPSEFLGNILLLIVGGNDTTRNSISGGVLALHQFPGRIRETQGQSRSDTQHGAGNRPLAVPGRPHVPHRHGGYRDSRHQDPQMGQAVHLVPVRQPGRRAHPRTQPLLDRASRRCAITWPSASVSTAAWATASQKCSSASSGKRY